MRITEALEDLLHVRREEYLERIRAERRLRAAAQAKLDARCDLLEDTIRRRYGLDEMPFIEMKCGFKPQFKDPHFVKGRRIVIVTDFVWNDSPMAKDAVDNDWLPIEIANFEYVVRQDCENGTILVKKTTNFIEALLYAYGREEEHKEGLPDE